MSCSKCQNAIYEGVSNQEVERHLEECGSCFDLAQKLADLEETFRVNVCCDSGYEEYRKRLILQKVEALQESSTNWIPYLIRAATICMVVALLIVPLSSIRKINLAHPSRAKQTINFELAKLDQSVQLRWKGDPRRKYRIYKGANPAKLEPVGEYLGLQWVDAAGTSQNLVFYKIEPL